MIENTEVEKQVHKEGRPWSEIGPRSTYEEILIEKKDFQDSVENILDLDLKIKHLSDGFYLKFREKESVILARQKATEEEAKRKKEKKRLNKTRR